LASWKGWGRQFFAKCYFPRNGLRGGGGGFDKESQWGNYCCTLDWFRQAWGAYGSCLFFSLFYWVQNNGWGRGRRRSTSGVSAPRDCGGLGLWRGRGATGRRAWGAKGHPRITGSGCAGNGLPISYRRRGNWGVLNCPGDLNVGVSGGFRFSEFRWWAGGPRREKGFVPSGLAPRFWWWRGCAVLTGAKNIIVVRSHATRRRELIAGLGASREKAGWAFFLPAIYGQALGGGGESCSGRTHSFPKRLLALPTNFTQGPFAVGPGRPIALHFRVQKNAGRSCLSVWVMSTDSRGTGAREKAV